MYGMPLLCVTGLYRLELYVCATVRGGDTRIPTTVAAAAEITALLDWEMGGSLPEEEELDHLDYFADTPQDLAYVKAQLEARLPRSTTPSHAASASAGTGGAGVSAGAGASTGGDTTPVRTIVNALDRAYTIQKWHPSEVDTIRDLLGTVADTLTALGIV